MAALIELEGITKDYGPLRALDGVSLRIGSGVTGLLGPNGAGKTTLIKVLLGLVRLTAGSGSVLGHRLGRETLAIRRRVGFMPEDDCYLAGLSGVEMVRYAARLSGLPSLEALRRAHEILDFCGMEQERYRNVETYSVGMRQKLKFAHAIVHDPPLLILDEPTSGMDPEQRDGMLSRIQILASREGKAVLISTHILPDVQAICDAVVILGEGRVRREGSMKDLNRTIAPVYHVRVRGDAELLAERIRQQGITVDVSSDGLLTLTEVDSETVQCIWSLAQATGVGIRSLTAAGNSMEQIFLEAVGESTRANS